MYFWHNVLECYDLLLKDETFMEYYVVINVIFYLFIKSQITILFFFFFYRCSAFFTVSVGKPVNQIVIQYIANHFRKFFCVHWNHQQPYVQIR